MDIRSTPLLSPSAAAPAPATPAVQPQAWLRELEHARWQAQPRHRPASPSQASAQQSPEQGPQEHGPVPVQGGPRGSPQHALPRGSETGNGNAAGPAREVPARPLPFIASPAAQLLALPLAAQAFVASELHRRRQRSSSPAAPEPAQPGADADWARSNVHVHLDAEELSVWIRDAGLDTEAALALLDRLAVLHDVDPRTYRQVRLTVNGQPIGAAAPLAQNNLSYRGEHRGD